MGAFVRKAPTRTSRIPRKPRQPPHGQTSGMNHSSPHRYRSTAAAHNPYRHVSPAAPLNPYQRKLSGTPLHLHERVSAVLPLTPRQTAYTRGRDPPCTRRPPPEAGVCHPRPRAAPYSNSPRTCPSPPRPRSALRPRSSPRETARPEPTAVNRLTRTNRQFRSPETTHPEPATQDQANALQQRDETRLERRGEILTRPPETARSTAEQPTPRPTDAQSPEQSGSRTVDHGTAAPTN